MIYTAIIIPCYNEASRFPVNRFVSFVKKHSAASIYFVNDGLFNSITGIQYQDLLTTYSSLISNINKRLFHFPHTKNNEEKVFLPYGHVKEKVHEDLAVETG